MMNIKDTFIKLTNKTYPYGHEEKLLSFLPKGYKKDPDGNFYYEIGESKTIFACHLDTACKDHGYVKHVFDGVYIRTDGKTILGADDKAGATILLYMIENNVPGLYYFFIGEEVGCIGSTAAAKRVDFFSNYDKIVSFDRRGTNSIITHQSGLRSCSDDFADSLSKEYAKYGLKLAKDDTGVYTDSAEFTSVIPECTNISVGYYKEHTTAEHQDILYLEDLAKASALINWESLTIKRDPSKYESKYDEEDYYSNYSSSIKYTSDVDDWRKDSYYTSVNGYRNKKRNRRSRSRTNYSYQSGKIYINDVDNEVTEKDNIVFMNREDDRSKKDYYKSTKKFFLDDKITYDEFKIIKDQCLDMEDESDRDFANTMESQFVIINNV